MSTQVRFVTGTAGNETVHASVDVDTSKLSGTDDDVQAYLRGLYTSATRADGAPDAGTAHFGVTRAALRGKAGANIYVSAGKAGKSATPATEAASATGKAEDKRHASERKLTERERERNANATYLLGMVTPDGKRLDTLADALAFLDARDAQRTAQAAEYAAQIDTLTDAIARLDALRAELVSERKAWTDKRNALYPTGSAR